MAEFRKINPDDSLIDWRDKFNHNSDESDDLKNRLDILETGGTVDGELIALRSSTTLDFVGATADERVEHAEGEILADRARIEALEARDLKILNVQDFGAVGDGVEDDSGAIQQALDAARDNEGGDVYVPPGTYAIMAPLRIFSNTRLWLSRGTTIIRAANIDAMLLSGIGNVDGYEGVHDVEVMGGMWDCNAQQFPSNVTGIAFGHARDITIRDTAILNVFQYHAVELNAVRNGRVINCLFDGFEGTRFTEAVQIDLMKSVSEFPWFGNYDGTPCENILVQGCTFRNWNRGVGSHSANRNVFHKNIRVIGNHFIDLDGQGVRVYQWRGVVVADNTFERVRIGIEVRPGDGVDASSTRDIAITGNTIITTTDASLGHSIWLNGTVGFEVQDVVIADNVIREPAVNGIFVDNAFRVNIRENNIRDTGNQGISVRNISYSQIQGNTIRGAQNNGIILNDCDNNIISNNVSYGNGVSATAELANIALVSGSDRNNIQGNTVRTISGQPELGIRITTTCNDNLMTNNDAWSGGSVAAIRDNGVGTVTTAGNRT